ncbi:MAG: T9SS type A sorting domain-containing protein [Bacteroidetes bacterium]|nr:T9SS type A sorting domain-containing protein [Bacteroidota bacterium]
MLKNYTLLKTVALITLLSGINHIAGSQTWTPQSSNITDNLNAVHFTDANNGIASGMNGAIVTTVDGGTTWVPRTSGVTANLKDVFMADPQTAYAVGLTGTIIKTSDGGATWATQTSGTTKLLSDVYFVSPSVGWVAGDDGTIKTTTDGGATWTSQASGTTSDLQAIFFISSTEGWITGNGIGLAGTVLHTSNAGLTWTLQTVPAGNYADIHFINANEGWIVGSSSAVAKTTDGGITWTSINIGLNVQIWAVHFVSSVKGWITVGAAVNQNSSMKISNDGGNTWLSHPTPINVKTEDAYFLNAGLGYSVGNSGIILKYTAPVGINDFENENAFSVYPNPANQIATIAWQPPLNKNLEIKIVDATGKEIQKLKSQNSKIEIDVSKFENGIYSIQPYFTSERTIVKSQKLIIQH